MWNLQNKQDKTKFREKKIVFTKRKGGWGWANG